MSPVYHVHFLWHLYKNLEEKSIKNKVNKELPKYTKEIVKKSITVFSEI